MVEIVSADDEKVPQLAAEYLTGLLLDVQDWGIMLALSKYWPFFCAMYFQGVKRVWHLMFKLTPHKKSPCNIGDFSGHVMASCVTMLYSCTCSVINCDCPCLLP